MNKILINWNTVKQLLYILRTMQYMKYFSFFFDFPSEVILPSLAALSPFPWLFIQHCRPYSVSFICLLFLGQQLFLKGFEHVMDILVFFRTGYFMPVSFIKFINCLFGHMSLKITLAPYHINQAIWDCLLHYIIIICEIFKWSRRANIIH